MCQAIRFTINNHPIVFNYSDSKPCLPLITPAGHIKIIPWGRPPESGPPPYPLGNTVFAREAKTQWKIYKPYTTRIGCEAFLMIDGEGNETWHKVKAGHIAGVVVTQFDDHRAYVLMRQRQLMDPEGFQEWPIYVAI